MKDFSDFGFYFSEEITEALLLYFGEKQVDINLLKRVNRVQELVKSLNGLDGRHKLRSTQTLALIIDQYERDNK